MDPASCLRAMALVTTFAALGGCSTPRPVASVVSDPAPALSLERRETVAPGKGLEVNLVFDAGGGATAVFHATGALFEWNVHSHPEGGLVIHEKGSGSDGRITFRAKTKGVYSFAWENLGAEAASLEVTVTGDPNVREWVRGAGE
jgi:hypothetical protein